jgi:hypothetical protein
MTTASRGLAYAQSDFDLANKYGVQGSPTLILNEQEVSEYDFGGRTSEAVKSLLCCGFSQKPDTCSTKLSETSAASSFSATYEGTGSSNSNASCN